MNDERSNLGAEQDARPPPRGDRPPVVALLAHSTTQIRATGLEHAVIPGLGTGRGSEVRLEGLGVCVRREGHPRVLGARGFNRGGGGDVGVDCEGRAAAEAGGRHRVLAQEDR